MAPQLWQRHEGCETSFSDEAKTYLLFLALILIINNQTPFFMVLHHDSFLFYKLREQRAASILATPKPELKAAPGSEKWLGYTEGASMIVQNSNKFLLCQMPVIWGLGFQPRISAPLDYIAAK